MPLVARHSSNHTVAHSLCPPAFESIILWEMIITQVSSNSPWALVVLHEPPPIGRICLRKAAKGTQALPVLQKGERKEGTLPRAGEETRGVEVSPHLTHLVTTPPRWVCCTFVRWGRHTSAVAEYTPLWRKGVCVEGKVCLTHCLPRKLPWSSHNLG